MQKRTLKVALLAALAVILVLSFSSVALADQTWSDLPDTVTAKYGINDNQVASISEGFANGLWKPYQSVTRAQYVKMAVAAFDIDLVSPATASYTDVPKGSFYYQYVEAAKAAGMINGASTFNPSVPITREQSIAIVARYIAKANGFDLATMYTADEVDHLLAHFGDAASISSALRTEVAFAFDFGITEGNAFGNVAPLDKVTRIQAAAFLIRAQAKVPPASYTPAKLELVSADKSENLIGQPHKVTFKVTDANGHPAKGVLVDFDTQFADAYYVGNISPQAALTDGNGEVTVNLLSAEPGTQRVSAAVRGLTAISTTKYWLALDEVYTVGTQTARNNVGVAHEWGVRVVVFGPGPRSTARTDWYNVISKATFDPNSIKVLDGIDYWEYYDGDFNYAAELALGLDGFLPRTMAGIDVEWTIYNIADNPLTKLTNEAVTSVGNITAVDGVAITAAKTAVGKTDANGFSKIKIESTVTGVTLTEAVADYAGNPYPELLLDHDSVDPGYAYHDIDWDEQPLDDDQTVSYATQTKTWIAHTSGTADTAISPAYSELNVGEEQILTVTLVDTYGNPVAGRTVEWYMQGVGQFKSDDDRTQSGDGLLFAYDRDIDVTDAAGTARVLVKSIDPGEQWIHLKYRDKGTGGAEGLPVEYMAEVQWFKVDVATFDNPATVTTWVKPYTDVAGYWDPKNEAVSVNEVGTTHTFDMWVYGLKLEYFASLAAGTQGPATQTPWIDTDAAGTSYDGVMSAADAKYLDPNGLLIVNVAELNAIAYDPITGKINRGTVSVPNWVVYKDAATGITLGAGGITEYDYDGDGVKETAADMKLRTGIYLPLEGKGVTFAQRFATDLASWTGLPASIPGSSIVSAGEPGSITYGGVATAYPAVTDAAGHAWVKVTSNKKGDQFVDGIVDYPANPFKGTQRVWARAWKTWTTEAVPTPHVVVTINGQAIDPGQSEGPNPVFDSLLQLNSAHVEVHVLDQYGNELPDYEVVYELVNMGKWEYGTQGAADTYHPWAFLIDKNPGTESKAAATLVTRYPTLDPITNAAATQKYQEFTASGTAGGTFNAILTPGGWNWELAVTGLPLLPITPAKASTETYRVYAVYAGAVKLREFNVDATGSIPTGKVFGVTAAANITAGTVITVKALENVGDLNGAPCILAAAATVVGVQDGNGSLPDNSEPRNDSVLGTTQTGVGPADLSLDANWADPLAVITGKGGTESYFFLRGAVKPPEAFGAAAGDGAKAWTLNGVDPTKPHGSSIDIQLVENPFAVMESGDDARTILNIQVFKPANGPVVDGTPWLVFEVQKQWAPTAAPGVVIGITPAEATNNIGEQHTVSAVLPEGADVEEIFFAWYKGDPADGSADDTFLTSGWGDSDVGQGADEYTYTGTVAGVTDEIYYKIYAAPWATAIATSTSSLKTWLAVSLEIENVEMLDGVWFGAGDPCSNVVNTTHTVRVNNADGLDAATTYWWQLVRTESNPDTVLASGTATGAALDAGTMLITYTGPQTVRTDTLMLQVSAVSASGPWINSNTEVKNWIAGTAAQITNPFWAVKNLVDPSAAPVWRFDSRVGEPTVTLPAGTPLIYKALVRDAFGNIVANTDITALHPKLLGTYYQDGLAVGVKSTWAPASYTTDAQGYLNWTNADAGYWTLTLSGDRGAVTFWLDLDDDGVIDAGAEAASAVPGYGDPWAQWLFGA